jgi:Pectate lyase superfamily protein
LTTTAAVAFTNADVETFQLAGNGTTDDQPNIQAALNLAQPSGGTVHLPPGNYAIGSPLILPPGVLLRGWRGVRTELGGSGAGPISTLVVLAGFTSLSSGAIQIIDKELGGYSVDNSTCQIRDLNIDLSGKTSGVVDGILVNGKCDGILIENVSIYKPPNSGVRFLQYQRIDTNFYKSINVVLSRVVVHTSGSIGFSFAGNTDCEISNCYSLGAGDDGFQFSTSCANTRLVGCRSEGSANHGYHVTGAWNTGTGSGGMTLAACSTDRSTKNGILVDATGNSPILIVGPQLRRDGRNGGGGGGGYAGIAVAAATVPVEVVTPTVFPGVEDNGTGTNSPQYGISITSTSTFVAVNGGGLLHANTAAWNDDGTSTVSRGAGIAERTGSTSAPTAIVVDDRLRWEWEAEELAWKGWNYDPLFATTSTGQASGVILGARFKVRRTIPISNLIVFVNTAGGTLTTAQNFAALYTISGGTATQARITADQTTAWGTTGIKTMAITTLVCPAGSDIIIAAVSNGTTSAKFAKAPGIANAQFGNGALGASGARFFTNGTGTTLPGTLTLSSNATSTDTMFVAVS